MQADLDHALDRKHSLKTERSEALAQVELLKTENQQLRSTWQEKSAVLDQLEAEARGLQRTYALREKRLLDERDAAGALVAAAEARVRQCDEALQRQADAHAAQVRHLTAVAEQTASELQAARIRIRALEEESASARAEAQRQQAAADQKAARLRQALRELQAE